MANMTTGVAAMMIQAPVANLVRITTTKTIPVTVPPTALITALRCHPGSRVRRHLMTVPN